MWLDFDDGCPVCAEPRRNDSYKGFYRCGGSYDPPEPAEEWCSYCGYSWMQSGTDYTGAGAAEYHATFLLSREGILDFIVEGAKWFLKGPMLALRVWYIRRRKGK